jgi:hypothetical protein
MSSLLPHDRVVGFGGPTTACAGPLTAMAADAAPASVTQAAAVAIVPPGISIGIQ